MNLKTNAVGYPGMLGTNLTSEGRLHRYLHAYQKRRDLTPDERIAHRVLAGYWNSAKFLGIDLREPRSIEFLFGLLSSGVFGTFEDFVDSAVKEPLTPYDEHAVNVRLRTKSNYKLYKAYVAHCHRQVPIDATLDIDLAEFFGTSTLENAFSTLHDNLVDKAAVNRDFWKFVTDFLATRDHLDAGGYSCTISLMPGNSARLKLDQIQFRMSWTGDTLEDRWNDLTVSAYRLGDSVITLETPWSMIVCSNVRLKGFELNRPRNVDHIRPKWVRNRNTDVLDTSILWRFRA